MANFKDFFYDEENQKYLTMLKFVLARQQYKKRNRKLMIINGKIFLGMLVYFV